MRPVVIIDGRAAAIVVAKVTTANPRERYVYCELADWEREGLLKPSRVQVAPLFQIAQSDLLNGEPLGVLSERDRRVLSLALIFHCSELVTAGMTFVDTVYREGGVYASIRYVSGARRCED